MNARIALRLLVVVALLSIAPSLARAHGASSSYLTIAADDATLQVQWEIAVRDLDYAIGLDSDADGAVTWGELRGHQAAIEAYALQHLTLSAGDAACRPGGVHMLADQRGDGAYAVLRFAAQCPAAVQSLTVRYTLLFDLDPMHRGLLRAQIGGASRIAALSPATPQVSLDAGTNLLAAAGQFFSVGVAHIFTGPDHMLFVAVLLLPAMFRRGSGGWVPVQRFRPAFVETVRLLTAFTLAHAITLTAATLGVIEIPSRLVESAIAATIIATAIDNITPILPVRRWVLAFAFGLIHGLGFASALGPLSLPPMGIATALVSFNLGVETAQLIVATLILPLGFALRNMRQYPARWVPAASGLVAVLALGWLGDRAFGWNLVPF